MIGPHNARCAEQKVSRLGDFRFWHLIEGAPLSGSIGERSDWLCQVWCSNKTRAAASWPIRPMALRAMAFELAVACGLCKEPLPESLAFLLSGLIGLPDNFWDDPQRIFEGKDTRGAKPPHPEAHDLAALLDGQHFGKTGKVMPLNMVARELQQRLELKTPPSRAMLREWRQDKDYRHFRVMVARDLRSWRKAMALEYGPYVAPCQN